MVNVLLLIAGIVAVVLAGAACIAAVAGTPVNLRGFYSAKYIPITLIGAVAGLVMIVSSFFAG